MAVKSDMLKAVALMGATGTGKSSLAMKIAQEFNTTIISCDSMQLYRGLDIGTAKASVEDQGLVQHFMIDCSELVETYSAARWAEEVATIIADENSQGRIPLIVGGTGMYLRALLEGFAEIPEENPEEREALQRLQQEHGTPYLHAQLKSVDPVTAERVKENDTQRIVRALGVYQSSGKPLSYWQQQDNSTAWKIDCPVVVLEVAREILRERISDRFQSMIDAGWLGETRWLEEQGVDELHPAKRAVGYRQLIACLHGESSLEEAIRDGVTATRRYAKRQQTWFRNQTPDAFIGDAESCYNEISKVLRG
ncbi:MAG: tRNA (adenosine(37)-N6)-dimethylallyltransferase MiaA [Mariprofundaceae bacterium]